MRFYFLYNQEDGLVASYSDNPNTQSQFQKIELEVTDEQYELMLQNYDLYIENGELRIVKPSRVIGLEKLQEIENIKKDFSEKVKNGDVELDDVIVALQKLINF